MRKSRYVLFWALLLVMLCIVSYGGCGGGDSSSGGGDSRTPGIQEDNSNNDDIARGDINGIWRIDSGAWYVNIPEVYNYTYPYVENSSSASEFEILVSKNITDEYYTLQLTGEGVTTNNENNITLPDDVMTQWEVTFKCRNDNVPSGVSNEFEQGIYGSDKFRHTDSNSYTCNFYNGVTFIYTIKDENTITYRLSLPTASGPNSNYGELTLKRVN